MGVEEGGRRGGIPVRADSAGSVWVSTERGSHLRGRRVRDTKPEVMLRSALHALGLRFRLNRILAGRYRPDLTFPGPRVAVFVDGCFWHGCPRHGASRFRGPNAALWEAKIAANKDRDVRANAALAETGWRVVRVWECEVKADVQQAACRVDALVRRAGSAPDGAPAD
ncbi:very short patch repair endonuclease [Micromonospora sp. NPDC049048]|uniref:very short patch repair endonuclease n=1 Tax=Micromonospora sp. NPDC049048 TaxID=3364263 RepID=UPI0037214409